MTRPRRMAVPRRIPVRARGTPVEVGGTQVASVCEEWVVEDRWWTGRPVRRRYFELVLEDGRNVVVFRDLVAHEWFCQRG